MKTVIITGANRGIGWALVNEFAYAGYNIWACVRQESDGFQNKIHSLERDTNVRIKTIYFELTNEDEIKDGVNKILSEKAEISVLINNAGIAYNGLMNMTSIAKMKEVFAVNVFAPVLIMQLVSRQMMKQRHGSIINMCSVGGIEANPGYLAYGSSKASLAWITRCASKELGAYNIRVNGIAPGLIDTEMGHTKSEDEISKVMKRMSIKRMGAPEEIAKLALYLASDDATFITGQIVVADGGRV